MFHFVILDIKQRLIKRFIRLNDPEVKSKWLRAIRRVDKNKFGEEFDYVSTTSSRVCSLHFVSDDFITGTQDTNVTRASKRPRVELKVLHLKPTAVPRVFKDYPSYLTPSVPSCPSRDRATSTVSARLKKHQQLNWLESEFLRSDGFCGFDNLCQRLSSMTLPSDYAYIKKQVWLRFMVKTM